MENCIGKYLCCIKTDKAYGIKEKKFYKITEVKEVGGINFYIIENDKFAEFGSKEGSKHFLSVIDSSKKLRYKKFNRILDFEYDED